MRKWSAVQWIPCCCIRAVRDSSMEWWTCTSRRSNQMVLSVCIVASLYRVWESSSTVAATLDSMTLSSRCCSERKLDSLCHLCLDMVIQSLIIVAWMLLTKLCSDKHGRLFFSLYSDRKAATILSLQSSWQWITMAEALPATFCWMLADLYPCQSINR